jgi:hypothetical protein
MLGCVDQYHQTTGAGLICIRKRFERLRRCVNFCDHARGDDWRREFRRLNFDCDDASEWHAELLKWAASG